MLWSQNGLLETAPVNSCGIIAAQEVPLISTSTGISSWETANRAAYSVGETAELLGISVATVNRLIGRGTIASVLIGRSRRISAEAIQKLLTADATPQSA